MVRGTTSRHVPERTCVGCRGRDSARMLVRCVASSDEHPRVVVDLSRSSPGRGAWLHPDVRCLRTAVRRRAFVPALRVGIVTVDSEDLEREIAKVSDPGNRSDVTGRVSHEASADGRDPQSEDR